MSELATSAGLAALPPLPPAHRDPLVGRVFNGRFRVEALIARGGMGKVYRASQDPLGRTVALKVLNPTYTGEIEQDFHQRFFLEASICAKLRHPNTVTIFDYGRTEDEIYYIAMELLEGRNLGQELRRLRVLGAARAVHIALQIGRSVREAHTMGVVHRDLKPANVFLVNHGDAADFVKVLDFGLVKNVLDPCDGLTQTGIFMGSPGYMSPEQIRGRPVDPRSDVYSLGVLLYEMLTGAQPFVRENSMETLLAHVNDKLPAFHETNPTVGVSPAVEAVVVRCMHKRPADRYANMDAVMAALRQACRESGTCMSDEGSVSGPPSASSTAAEVFLATPREPRREPTCRPRDRGPVPPEERDGGWEVVSSSGALSAPGALPAAAERAESIVEPGAAPASSLASRGRRWIVAGGVVAALAAGALVGQRVMRLGHDAPPSLPASAADPARLDVPRAAPVAATLEPTVAVVANEAKRVAFALRSRPRGASVFAGAQLLCAKTPCSGEWLGKDAEDGRRVVLRFELGGYKDLTTTRVLDGSNIDVLASLIRRRSARREQPEVATAGSPAPKAHTPLQATPAETQPPAGVPDGYKANPY